MRKALWFGIGLAAGVLLAMLLVVVAVEAAELQKPQASEDNWQNLERLPGGSPIIVEDIDGKWHEGRLLGVADDALSLAQRKRVRGIRRERVERIWLLGDRQTKKGAAIGAITLGLIGGLTGGIAGATSGESGEGTAMAVFGGLTFAGIGAGIGAAIGAGIRERTLIYRAPPSRHPSPTPIQHPEGDFSVRSAPCPQDAESGFPAPLRDVCRLFSVEEAAREASMGLFAGKRRKGEWR